ncbi:hypothetical protein RFI_12071 [Reticulomyxa filosa]|uniref:Eukaryotic translation initiation factor 3 subunit E N-terminal domain-containing protein n=1 Tax=Reticulomyxa filosa TaxID=46433 RepID=X6NFH3_RETFI|nr:hypothetical protein RFI_12071 [Reticulomyxa filosa]|eukprot:ETO25070.1 hypothetical protein RFI_12071 [Reticulomyxa filosa]
MIDQRKLKMNVCINKFFFKFLKKESAGGGKIHLGRKKKMEFDLTLDICKNLDPHLVLHLLDFLSTFCVDTAVVWLFLLLEQKTANEEKFYSQESILKAKTKVLQSTKMIDAILDLERGTPAEGDTTDNKDGQTDTNIQQTVNEKEASTKKSETDITATAKEAGATEPSSATIKESAQIEGFLLLLLLLFLLLLCNQIINYYLTKKNTLSSFTYPPSLTPPFFFLEIDTIDEKAQRVVNLLSDTENIEKLVNQKQLTAQYLSESYDVSSEDVELLFDWCRVRYQCGVYQYTDIMLDYYHSLTKDANRSYRALWGKLVCEILQVQWCPFFFCIIFFKKKKN